jgi:hypothetical protein
VADVIPVKQRALPTEPIHIFINTMSAIDLVSNRYYRICETSLVIFIVQSGPLARADCMDRQVESDKGPSGWTGKKTCATACVGDLDGTTGAAEFVLSCARQTLPLSAKRSKNRRLFMSG